MSTEMKAAKLREILDRASRRQNEDARAANAEQLNQDRLDREDDQDEKALLQKIQATYEKYLEKKAHKKPPVSREFKDEVSKNDLKQNSITWKYVTYDDLDLLDLN